MQAEIETEADARPPLTITVARENGDYEIVRDVAPGEDVVIFGRQGDEEITVGDVAAWAGTITWDILTRLGKRVVLEQKNT